MMEQAKFIYPPLKNSFKKQIIVTEDQGEKQTKALESLSLSIG